MSGQPLSAFKNFGYPTFGAGSVFKRPKLAPYVMEQIELWSVIDSTVLLIVNDCLQSSPVVATAMLQAVDSQSAQRAAILAAVQAVLPPEDWSLFQAGFLSTTQSRVVRHSFAHNLWGVTDALPAALLLLDARERGAEHARRITRVAERVRKGVNPGLAGESFNPVGVSVWRETDFKKEIAESKRCQTVMSRLWQLVSHHQRASSKDSTRLWLSQEPAIAQRLQKASQKKRD